MEKGNPSPEDLRLAREGFDRASEAVRGDRYDVVILDEVNVAVDCGLLALDEVLELIEEKPSRLELILTGRYAHQKIIDSADTVTEMKEVKHHHGAGIEAREGIEF